MKYFDYAIKLTSNVNAKNKILYLNILKEYFGLHSSRLMWRCDPDIYSPVNLIEFKVDNFILNFKTNKYIPIKDLSSYEKNIYLHDLEKNAKFDSSLIIGLDINDNKTYQIEKNPFY
tara:strand:- start:2523 stop:2873 length:351 start_codon:yes stop_codon:yes gene_type:complete